MKEAIALETRWERLKTDLGLVFSVIGLSHSIITSGKGSAWLILFVFSIFGIVYFSPPIFRRVREKGFGRSVAKKNFYFLEPMNCQLANSKKYLITDAVRNQFTKVSRDALAYLFNDQLPSTGGWAKTYFWRQKVDAKGRPSSGSIPAAGTFTGTMAAPSLPIIVRQ